jgi:hypothetical protein
VLTALPGVLVFSTAALGAPLDYVPFSTLKVEGFLSWLDGRVGFEQQPGGTGTLNDFRKDLGLPADHKTFRLILSVRPLEHHLLRLYGSVPEIYKGERNLDRTLQTRNTIYPAGSDIETEMTYGSFGLGYDLNFLEGPRWYAGLNGDLRYINARFRIMGTGVNSGREDTLSITELVPCVGGHASVKTMMPFPGRAMMPICGGFARMDFGLMPDYLNYTDIRLGLSTELPTPFGPLFELKVGYEHESIFHDRESVSGKILEFKRDGVFVSLGAAF